MAMRAAKVGGRVRLRERRMERGGRVRRRVGCPERNASEVALRGRHVVGRSLRRGLIMGEKRRPAVATDARDVGVRLVAVAANDRGHKVAK